MPENRLRCVISFGIHHHQLSINVSSSCLPIPPSFIPLHASERPHCSSVRIIRVSYFYPLVVIRISSRLIRRPFFASCRTSRHALLAILRARRHRPSQIFVCHVLVSLLATTISPFCVTEIFPLLPSIICTDTCARYPRAQSSAASNSISSTF